MTDDTAKMNLTNNWMNTLTYSLLVIVFVHLQTPAPTCAADEIDKTKQSLFFQQELWTNLKLLCDPKSAHSISLCYLKSIY